MYTDISENIIHTDSILQLDNVKTLQNTHITQYLLPLPFKKYIIWNRKQNLFFFFSQKDQF